MKEIKIFFTALIMFALLAGLSPRANAADTSDVIAGIIFGGILGSEIQKSKHRDDVILVFPKGTIIVPARPTYHYETCWYELDSSGLPIYATPDCFMDRSKMSRWDLERRTRDRRSGRLKGSHYFPCGQQWGARCEILIRQLK